MLTGWQISAIIESIHHPVGWRVEVRKMAPAKLSQQKQSGSGGFLRKLRRFVTVQKDVFLARTSSPSMHGINLVHSDYTPSKLAEYPGYGSHEEIEPMK
jgi:hypothetical protein